MRRALLLLPLLTGCGGPLSAMAPASGVATLLERLIWEFFWVVGIASILVLIAFYFALTRARFGRNLKEQPFILVGGFVLPLTMVLALLVSSLRASSAVASGPVQDAAFTVQVVGHQFWWEVIYPDHGIVTANEIYMPTGTRIQLDLASADVLHSFWVPKLHRKLDMMPDRWHSLAFDADEPGVYRGICTEFCGVQHALMAFEVVALPPAEFEAWVQARRRPTPEPRTEAQRRGREVFVEADCARCHAVRDHFLPGETGAVGPDLTHIATRRTLGAGTLPNNRGNLGGWILNPQPFKPGNRMPAVALPSEDLHALLAYLEMLE